MIDTVRKLCGYKFPRLGKFVNRCFFAICPTQVQCELFPGVHVELHLKDLTQQATFWQGERFEYPTANILKSWGGELSAFFDIGANYGFYSLFMLSTFPQIIAYAFEPNPSTYELLSKIRDNNKLSRLQLLQCGLGRQTGQFDLHPGITDSGHSTFLPHPELVNQSIGKVNILTFQEWMDDQKIKLPTHPEWVAKIDVEGMEYDVLVGMQKAIEARAFRGIIIEVLEHTLAFADHSPEDIFYFMKTMGYKSIDSKNLIQRYGRVSTANTFFEPVIS